MLPIELNNAALNYDKGNVNVNRNDRSPLTLLAGTAAILYHI